MRQLASFLVAILTAGTHLAARAADPADAAAAVPKAEYRSPFARYQPLGEDTLLPWKAANDEVARIGGWRAYLKERDSAPVKDVTPPAPAKPEPPAKPPVHKH